MAGHLVAAEADHRARAAADAGSPGAGAVPFFPGAGLHLVRLGARVDDQLFADLLRQLLAEVQGALLEAFAADPVDGRLGGRLQHEFHPGLGEDLLAELGDEAPERDGDGLAARAQDAGDRARGHAAQPGHHQGHEDRDDGDEHRDQHGQLRVLDLHRGVIDTGRDRARGLLDDRQARVRADTDAAPHLAERGAGVAAPVLEDLQDGRVRVGERVTDGVREVCPGLGQLAHLVFVARRPRLTGADPADRVPDPAVFAKAGLRIHDSQPDDPFAPL
ncbi:MAG: hypothetical protein ABW000_19610 [Actinoplanes sp.]